ncbi:MAG: hypothetical protein ACOYBS_04490 [Flavobacterium sp.]
MKVLKSLIAIALFMASNTISAQAVTEKWKQLGNYQEVLSNTFKPSEDGDFGPIKLSSQELVTKVEALDVTTMPQDLRTPRLEDVIVILKRQTKVLNELVKAKAPNAEIMRIFENVHDIYNRVVYVCNNLKK